MSIFRKFFQTETEKVRNKLIKTIRGTDDVAKLKSFLKKKVTLHRFEVNRVILEDDLTPFLYACVYGSVEAVKVIVVEGGANIGDKNSSGRNGLMLACTTPNRLSIVLYLVEELSFPLGHTDNKGNNALHLAIKHGAVKEVIEVLLKHKCRYDLSNADGQRPLEMFPDDTYRNKVMHDCGIIQVLAQAPSPKKRSVKGMKALQYDPSLKHLNEDVRVQLWELCSSKFRSEEHIIEIVDKMMSLGEASVADLSLDMCFRCIEVDRLAVLRHFVSSLGVPIMRCDARGYSVMSIAVLNERIETVKYLLSLHTVLEFESLSNLCFQSLALACAKGSLEIAKYLMRAGADMSARDGSLWTALHCAALHKQYSCLLLLVQKRVDVLALTNKGEIALDFVPDSDEPIKALLRTAATSASEEEFNNVYATAARYCRLEEGPSSTKNSPSKSPARSSAMSSPQTPAAERLLTSPSSRDASPERRAQHKRVISTGSNSNFLQSRAKIAGPSFAAPLQRNRKQGNDMASKIKEKIEKRSSSRSRAAQVPAEILEKATFLTYADSMHTHANPSAESGRLKVLDYLNNPERLNAVSDSELLMLYEMMLVMTSDNKSANEVDILEVREPPAPKEERERDRSKRLFSTQPDRQEIYDAVSDEVMANEISLWFIFTHYCEKQSAADVPTCSCFCLVKYRKVLLSQANLKQLLLHFGVLHRICSDADLDAALGIALQEASQEMTHQMRNIMSKDKNSPVARLSAKCDVSFSTFIKVLIILANTESVVETRKLQTLTPADRFNEMLVVLARSRGSRRIAEAGAAAKVLPKLRTRPSKTGAVAVMGAAVEDEVDGSPLSMQPPPPAAATAAPPSSEPYSPLPDPPSPPSVALPGLPAAIVEAPAPAVELKPQEDPPQIITTEQEAAPSPNPPVESESESSNADSAMERLKRRMELISKKDAPSPVPERNDGEQQQDAEAAAQLQDAEAEVELKSDAKRKKKGKKRNSVHEE